MVSNVYCAHCNQGLEYTHDTWRHSFSGSRRCNNQQWENYAVPKGDVPNLTVMSLKPAKTEDGYVVCWRVNCGSRLFNIRLAGNPGVGYNDWSTFDADAAPDSGPLHVASDLSHALEHIQSLFS